MAIARMLKVSVIAHGSISDTIVDALQCAGVIEIDRLELEDAGAHAMVPDQARINALDEVVAQAQFVRDFLGGYRTSETALSTFISEKIHLAEDEFHSLEVDERFRALNRECTHISDRLGTIARERTRLLNLVHDLEPWRDLHLEIAAWKGTEHVALFTGTIKASDSQAVRQALRDAVDEVSVAEVGQAGEREAWVVMAHKERVSEVKEVLALTEFTEVSFPDLGDYPAEEISLALEHIESLDAEETGLTHRAEELAADYKHVAALVQALLSRRDALTVRERFARTERTFLIRGWVPVRRREELIGALEPVGFEVDVTFEEPGAEDVVPVELVNPSVIRPFEVLTDLYGRPTYRAFDPTPILAPFFFLFFGMCLGDVGYGLMLLGGAWLIKNRLDVAPGVRKFMDLLMLGGVASVIWGALTRSYMALQPERLPGFLQYKPLIDPQSELILLLGVSVAIGVIHVSVGVALAVYTEWVKRDIVEAISEHVTVLVFIASLIVAILGIAGVVSAAVVSPALIFGFSQLVLLKGRVLDPLLGRKPLWQLALVPLRGLLGLYGMIGFGSDFLSYTRLAALGLASLYVGDAMNRLSELAGAAGPVGLIAAALIFVVGHTFNVVINLLGAFVHPTRLQYVEFFSKFYEGGGRPFVPFAQRTKQLVLSPQTAGEQEGGTRS